MRKISLVFLVVLSILSSCVPPQQNRPEKLSFTPLTTLSADISMYPVASDQEVQHVIELPALDNELNYKVAIFVAKEMEVDCNSYFLQGSLVEKELEGWGYSYYSFETNGEVMSTMMGCPDNSFTKKDSNRLINEAVKLLSDMTGLVAIITEPKFSFRRISNLKFVKINSSMPVLV